MKEKTQYVCITKLHNVKFTFGELLANARETKSNVAFTTLSCKYMYPRTLTASTLIILFSEKYFFEICEGN
jgi:hypothetical protein